MLTQLKNLIHKSYPNTHKQNERNVFLNLPYHKDGSKLKINNNILNKRSASPSLISPNNPVISTNENTKRIAENLDR